MFGIEKMFGMGRRVEEEKKEAEAGVAQAETAAASEENESQPAQPAKPDYVFGESDLSKVSDSERAKRIADAMAVNSRPDNNE